jgi:hypothetical protein
MNLAALVALGLTVVPAGQIDPENRMYVFQGTWTQTFRVADNAGVQIRRTMRVNQLDVTLVTELIGDSLRVTPSVINQIGDLARDLRSARRLEHSGTAQIDRNRNMLVGMRWMRMSNGARTRRTTNLTFTLSNANRRVSLVNRSTQDYDPETMTLNKQDGGETSPPVGGIDPENRIFQFQGTWEGTYAVTGGGSLRRILVLEGVNATLTTEWLGRNDPPDSREFRRMYGDLVEFFSDDDRIVHTGTAQIDRDRNLLVNLTTLRVAGRQTARKTDVTFALTSSSEVRKTKASDSSYGDTGIVLRRRS